MKAGSAELLYAYIDVEPVSFNRGFYTVDVRYFYRITADAFVGAARPVEVTGLAVFDKRVILFGSEGSAKVFSSQAASGALDLQALPGRSNPTAVVESVDRLSEDGKCTVSASLAEGAGWLGETCSFTVVLQSGVYPMVIPIEALREDTIGYFCLAVQPEKTILGEELTAVRVNVEVLEKSSTSAAVSGAVTSVTPLVLSSNKSVSPGDRVRRVTE